MKTLMTLRNIVIGTTLITTSLATFATETTWDFTSSLASPENSNGTYGSGSGTSSYGNVLSFNSGALKVNAWADTKEADNPDTIQNATAARNGSGLLNYNRNNDGHYVDNSGDTDMLLFTFDELVNITNINIGYIKKYRDGSSADSDISIAAFDSMPTLQGQTWGQVAAAASFKSSYANLGLGTNSLGSSTTGVEAKFWLIGAYNGLFGSSGWTTGNDFLKIAGITTKPGTPAPPNEVAEPGTLALLASFGAFIMWRRRKSA